MQLSLLVLDKELVAKENLFVHRFIEHDEDKAVYVRTNWTIGTTFGDLTKVIFNVHDLTRTVFVLEGKSKRSRLEDEQWKEDKGASRPVSTKRLPQSVCSILSISKAGPPAQ